jgi:2-dehydro-3-deoxyphosphogluconate aldolase/(4S)-4-hydroxy-2-oxoglutarate aldolase
MSGGSPSPRRSKFGVVAVIRLKDPRRCAWWAMAEGACARGDDDGAGRRRSHPRAGADAAVRILLGAGTVTDAATARAVIDAGASFVVGPVFRPDVAACHERDIAAMPGCFSPTEILAAHECGADIVKVFRPRPWGRSSSETCAAAAG